MKLFLSVIWGCVSVDGSDGAVRDTNWIAEVCGDGLDNDRDGLADCTDPDCESAACPEDCLDGRDNDANGATDCADSACVEVCIEDCEDEVDNDRDGLLDCADPDCLRHAECAEDCGDGVDNDYDGLTDCADADCRSSPSCEEVCIDGVDNDLDGLVDCEDADCTGECTELCDDGVDNNANGDVDCADVDCWGVGSCLGPGEVRFQGGFGQVSLRESRPLGSGSGSRILEVNLSSVTGFGQFALSGSSHFCTWTAQEMHLEQYQGRFNPRLFFSAQDVQSDGGCLGYIDTSAFRFGAKSIYASSSYNHWSYFNASIPLVIDSTSVLRTSVISSSFGGASDGSSVSRYRDAKFQLVPGGPWVLWSVP